MLPSTTSTNVLFRWKQEKKLRAGNIILSREPFRSTRWAEAVVTGPQSLLRPGDELLLSARPATTNIHVNGETLMLTSDAATLAFWRTTSDDTKALGATKGTVIFEWLEPEEEVTESGIVLVKKAENKELEARRAKVWAAGPESGVQAGDTILTLYNKDAYAIETIVEGKKLQNCGAESVICFWRNT